MAKWIVGTALYQVGRCADASAVQKAPGEKDISGGRCHGRDHYSGGPLASAGLGAAAGGSSVLDAPNRLELAALLFRKAADRAAWMVLVHA